jgi:hypothetical protein
MSIVLKITKKIKRVTSPQARTHLAIQNPFPLRYQAKLPSFVLGSPDILVRFSFTVNAVIVLFAFVFFSA